MSTHGHDVEKEEEGLDFPLPLPSVGLHTSNE
jgi:hypothetical protein